MEIAVTVADPGAPYSTSQRTAVRPGGRGLVQAIAAARMGGHVAMISAVGADTFGREIIHRLQREGVNTAGLSRVSEQTGMILRIQDSAGLEKEILTPGANLTLRAAQTPILNLGPRTLILLQDDIEFQENQIVIQRAKERGARIMFHALRAPPDMLDHIDVLALPENLQPPTGFKGLCVTTPKTDFAANCFCGALAAGLQTGADIDYVLDVAHTMAALVQSIPLEAHNPMPYWDEVKDNLGLLKNSA